MNLYVILCGVGDDGGPYGPIPDVYGPFNTKAEAEEYLARHVHVVTIGIAEWVECDGGVTPSGHDITPVFK